MRAVLLLAVLACAAAPADSKPLPEATPHPPALAARLAAALAAKGPDYEPRTRQRAPDGAPLYTNRLILEASPYLQQHAHNPVDWFPWGDEAFARAKQSGRPLFVSIGYSTCHWCHVMEEESFDDPETAALMNRLFVPVKVDREERPDVDGVYLSAVHAMTGSGGWPLNVFLTPDGHPIYGGTYFPPGDDPSGRRPGFRTVLERVAEVWQTERSTAEGVAKSLLDEIRPALRPAASVGVAGARHIDAAWAGYRSRYDEANGGVVGRTKFPSSLPIPLLLRVHRRTGDARALAMARRTLDAMARGGIRDHVGGGFHRYTVEPTWTVPHFEKMLYDNALLAVAYVEAFQATGNPAYADVARDVLDYLDREMSARLGTFHAATDADSAGEEGTFFLWTPQSVRAAVGEELAPLALAAYGVTGRGNFEGGRSVLRRDASLDELAGERDSAELGRQLDEIRARLRRARSKRVPPHADRKQIVAWNGLAIAAFARAGLVLREPARVERAARAARALLDGARPGGRLARYLIDGTPHGVGLLDDHAFLIAGLLDLFEASGDPTWLDAALSLQSDLDARFFDEAAGGYFLTPSDGERLPVREKPAYDGALPSGNSYAALNALRLELITGDRALGERGEMTLRALAGVLDASPTALGRLLEAVDFAVDRPREIAIVAPRDRAQAEPFLAALGRVFLPNRMLVVAAEPELAALAERVPVLRHKRAIEGETTAYVCVDRVCDAPTRDPEEFTEQLRGKPGTP